jgi:phage terminase large subunit-like protein
MTASEFNPDDLPKLRKWMELKQRLSDQARIRVDLLSHQTPPDGHWFGWLIQAGRGSGKTAAIADYVTRHVNGPACIEGRMPHKMALIAPTIGDAVESADRHPICLASLSPDGALRQKAGGTIFTWPNGSEMKLFGTLTQEDVERLRAGGNNCLVWAEELATWKRLDEAWDQMLLGLRIGPHPHWVGSSTPKRRKRYREIVDQDDIIRTFAHTDDNPYLTEEFRNRLMALYGHTALGRQELAGELIEEVEGAYWHITQIDRLRWRWDPPRLGRVVVGVDPPGGVTEAGIVACGQILGPCPCGGELQPHWVVMRDLSLLPTGPNHWASVAISGYHDLAADLILAETNYGGDMVLNTVRNIDPTVNAERITASRGKIIRAEPIAGLYGDPARPDTWEHGRVHHMGEFPELEDEMTSYTLEDIGTWSPNRLDALVWALTKLADKHIRTPKVHAPSGSVPDPRGRVRV